MTKQELNEIRARCEANKGYVGKANGERDIYQMINQDIPALLDALEMLKDSTDTISCHLDIANSHVVMPTEDRDRWKARAEKAEKSLVQYGYTDDGDELWAPLAGKAPDFDLADKWHKRAEALERAIRETAPCSVCVSADDLCHNCSELYHSHDKNDKKKYDDLWKFNEARFAEGDGASE